MISFGHLAHEHECQAKANKRHEAEAPNGLPVRPVRLKRMAPVEPVGNISARAEPKERRRNRVRPEELDKADQQPIVGDGGEAANPGVGRNLPDDETAYKKRS